MMISSFCLPKKGVTLHEIARFVTFVLPVVKKAQKHEQKHRFTKTLNIDGRCVDFDPPRAPMSRICVFRED